MKLFVSAFGAHVVTKSANARLRDDQFAAGDSMKDQVFVFRTLENDGRFPPMTN